MKKLLIFLPLVLSTPLLAADQTLTSLPAAGALGGAELLYCVQAAADTKCTPAQMSTFTAGATATLTNKTYDTAGVGNVFRINGTAIAAVTGTGSVVLGTAPTITLANGTGLPISTGVSGLGTGVATALGIAVGTAGSVLTNGGAGQFNAIAVNNGLADGGNIDLSSQGFVTWGIDNLSGTFRISALGTAYFSLGGGGAGAFASTTTSSSPTTGSLTAAGGLGIAGNAYIGGLTVAAGSPSAICQNAATKEITVNAAATCTVSSLAFKHDFKPLDGSVLPAILAMRPGSFFYNDSDRQRIGFASEYMAEVDPRLADGWDKDGHPRSFDQAATIAYLVRGMQELVEEIERLKAKR